MFSVSYKQNAFVQLRAITVFKKIFSSLSRLVASLSLQRLGLYSVSDQVMFVKEGVTLVQALLQNFTFSPKCK